MELYHGRPENEEGRQEKEIRVYDLLDQLEMDYYRTDHEPAGNMEACHEIDAVLETIICKNLFLCTANKKHYYLLMMPGDKPFKTKVLSKQIQSSRLSYGKPDAMLEYLDIEPGSVSIMGLMNDHENHVQLLIDEDVLKAEFLGCHPCVNTSSLKLVTRDVIDKFLPAVHHEAIVVTQPWEVE